MLSSPTSTTLIDDYVGVESCLHLKTNEELEAYQRQLLQNPKPRHQLDHANRNKERKKKEFPPPLSWLAQTENNCPRIMKRYHTTDGRLVIREEKSKHREYLRSERRNGRLTLHRMITVDDRHADDDVVLDNKNLVVKDDGIEKGRDDEKNDEVKSDNISGITGGFNGGGGKCFELKKKQMSSSPRSCILGIELPAARPIRI